VILPDAEDVVGYKLRESMIEDCVYKLEVSSSREIVAMSLTSPY